jgi:hypothetical protein
MSHHRLHGARYVAQTTAAGKVFYFTGATSGFDFLRDFSCAAE